MTEYDAAIYAEYHYRKQYNTCPNFPEMDDMEIGREYDKAIERQQRYIHRGRYDNNAYTAWRRTAITFRGRRTGY